MYVNQKRIFTKMLVIILALLMLITSIPLNNIVTFAEGGSGGSESGRTGSVGVSDDPLNDEDIGLRFSVVTMKNGNRELVKNIYGTCYIDVWADGYVPDYNNVTDASRYLPKPTASNISVYNASAFDDDVAYYLIGKYTSIEDMSLMDIKNHLNPGESASNTFFTESGGFHVNGNLFFNWFMEKSAKAKGGDNKEHSRYYWFMKSMYAGKDVGIDMNNTFLVVEPILHLRTVNGTKTSGNYTIASWYGYISSYEAGNAYTIIKRMGHLADGFNLKRTSYVTSETEQAIKNVLDTNILTDDNLYKIKTNPNGTVSQTNFKENNKHKTFGFAMQAFWLENMSNSIPIDTFDIETNKPNVPYYPEEPKDENKTTGEKTIIKLYADLYKDPTTGYYTEIKDIKNGDSYSFVRNNVSDKVTITDEQPINGYKATAWYLSNKNYPEASSEDNAMLKASNMISTSNIAETDGTVNLSQLGGSQLRINQYEAAYKDGIGYNADGGQRYFTGLASPHGANGNGLDVQQTAGASQYYGYKRLEVSGTSNYSNGQEYSLYCISKAVRAFIFCLFRKLIRSTFEIVIIKWFMDSLIEIIWGTYTLRS